MLAITQAAGVICAPVNDLNDVVNDPHLIARGTLETTEHPHLGSIQQMHSAIRFTGETPQTLSPAPALGSNTKAILSELLSLDDSDIASLVEEDAILTGE